MLTKRQRNVLFKIVVDVGFDPSQCSLTERKTRKGFRAQIDEKSTGSTLVLLYETSTEWYEIRRIVGDETLAERFTATWSDVAQVARDWAQRVKEFPEIPDLWTELISQKEALSGSEYDAMSNAPFTSDEQLRVAGRLNEIRQYLKSQYSLSDEQFSKIDIKLDEIEKATHRIGRKDWLMMFYGVMFTLIVTALLPPDTVQHIIVTVIHSLGDLFGFGGQPPSLRSYSRGAIVKTCGSRSFRLLLPWVPRRAEAWWHPEGSGRRRQLRGMLVAVTGSAPAWRTALGELPIVRGGRWAVGGSASLALHGLPVDPRDLDLLVDHVAAAELVDGLRGAVVSDEARWDRGDVRAVRRALAVVHGVEVEILEGVEAVGPTGDVVVATPDLGHVDRIIVSGRRIPVLPLPVIQVLLDATGNRERAAMVAKVLGAARDC